MHGPQNLPFKLPNPVVFSLFTRLYHHHCYLISEYFQNPQRNPIPLGTLPPLPSFPGNHFLSVWTCPFWTFHTNGTHNLWPLCPAPCTWHHVFRGRPGWSMGQCCIPSSCGWRTVSRMDSPHFKGQHTHDASAERSVQGPSQPCVNVPSLLLPPAG